MPLENSTVVEVLVRVMVPLSQAEEAVARLKAGEMIPGTQDLLGSMPFKNAIDTRMPNDGENTIIMARYGFTP